MVAIAVAAISGEIGVEPLPTAAVNSAIALAADKFEAPLVIQKATSFAAAAGVER
jgi:hypothetical protein